MELATQALGSLLPKLGTLLSDEYKLHKGVRGEIKFLQAEMESMQVVLNMLSKLPADQITELDKIWVRNLKELSYDIEDSVDTFMVRIDTPVSDKPHSFKRFFDKTIGLLTKAKVRHHVANDMEDIKRRIREVADRRERYMFEGVAARPPDTATVDPRVLASFEHAAKLVGTDVPVQKISSFLTKGKDVRQQKKRMVVSIVGVGGLGKTTVANLVYERLGGQFDCQAFVSVSLRPNIKQILSSILRQVSGGMCTSAGEMDPDELIRNIRKSLKDKRYFIVIDDVWSEEAWKIIEASLIDNNLGSRVILTTRNVEVANLSSSDDGAMYELDPLSYDDSKNLFSKRIFNEEEGILCELEDVTTKILKKCGGIPLAIITIASMLASMPNKTNLEWYSVYKSMGSGLERDKSFGNMREILYLSYGDLPSYLKPCLLYLSMFPEDYEIPRENLIRLWVAEGFVDDGERGSNLYELGERYFNELVNRSMIQQVDIDTVFGTGLGCRVHDMILDLIISLSVQENFATISEGSNLISPVGKIRRLSLQGNKVYRDVGDSIEEKVILSTTANVSQVRTLVAFGDVFQLMSPLSKFSILRVLVLLCSCNIKGIGRLHHLRYLELRGGDFGTVLEEIGNLKHLKTLDLSNTGIIELPASIVKLKQLECLMTDGEVRFPDGIGDLVSLQQLEFLNAEKSPHTLAELGNLTGLRVLSVVWLTESYEKTFLQNLSNLHNLRILNVSGDCSLDCIPDQWSAPARLQCVDGRLQKLPPWFSSLSELSCLFIYVKILRQDDLQLLGALPMLRGLSVYGQVITEERLVIGTDHPFRALTYFNFEHNQRCWLVFARGVMPKLQRLELKFSAQKIAGGGFDVGLENLTSLKLVKVTVDCTDARITEVEDIEAKWRGMIHMHPNHPTLDQKRYLEWHMPLVDNSEASEQQRSTYPVRKCWLMRKKVIVRLRSSKGKKKRRMMRA